MSRTDVHRPAWVQEADWYNRALFIEWHDHGNGVCDIRDTAVLIFHYKGQCYRVPRGGRNLYCGCRLCTGYYDQRAERRKSRHAARLTCREEMKEIRGWRR